MIIITGKLCDNYLIINGLHFVKKNSYYSFTYLKYLFTIFRYDKERLMSIGGNDYQKIMYIGSRYSPVS